jgi:copper chaperone NosL
MISHIKKVFAPQVRKTAINLFLIVIFAFPAVLHSQPAPVPQGAKCAECGMTVDQSSKFMSEVITNDNKNLFFCDIGDMLLHFNKRREKIKDVHVKDYSIGEWIDGKKAFYVSNKNLKTPMSWGIAAFAAESAAKKWGDPADFNGAFKLLR